jgi:heme exporter protein CcmD
MAEALSMGKYATFVWTSFGLALAIFAWNVVSPVLQRRAILERLAQDEESQPS